MNTLMGITKNWHRMSFGDRGIWIFFGINTLAILALLKLIILGK